MWREQKYGSGWFSFFKQTNKSGWIGVRRMHLMVRSGFSSDPSPLAGLLTIKPSGAQLPDAPSPWLLPLHGSISSGSSGVAVDFDQPDVGKEELAPISYRNMHNLGHGNEAIDRVSNNSVAVY